MANGGDRAYDDTAGEEVRLALADAVDDGVLVDEILEDHDGRRGGAQGDDLPGDHVLFLHHPFEGVVVGVDVVEDEEVRALVVDLRSPDVLVEPDGVEDEPVLGPEAVEAPRLELVVKVIDFWVSELRIPLPDPLGAHEVGDIGDVVVGLILGRADVEPVTADTLPGQVDQGRLAGRALAPQAEDDLEQGLGPNVGADAEHPLPKSLVEAGQVDLPIVALSEHLGDGLDLPPGPGHVAPHLERPLLPIHVAARGEQAVHVAHGMGDAALLDVGADTPQKLLDQGGPLLHYASSNSASTGTGLSSL